jgi:hypothetical protein
MEILRNIQKLFEQTWHSLDVKTVAAVAAVAVALMSWRTSRRALALAERTHQDKGRLRAVEISGVSTLQPNSTSSDLLKLHPNSVLSAYAGPDVLTVEDVELTVSFTQGAILRRNFVLKVSIASHYDNLQITGPRLPADVKAWDRLEWRLPGTVVAPGAWEVKIFDRKWPGPDGVILMGAFEELALDLVATTSGHQRCRKQIRFRQQWTKWLGVVAIRITYSDLGALLDSKASPDRLKALLRGWLKPAAEQIKGSQDATARRPRSRQGKRKRR